MSSAKLRQERDMLNLQKAMYIGEGEFRFPIVPRADDYPKDAEWITFNFVRGCKEPEKHAVHFFMDDYQFERVWRRPDQYGRRLAQFQAVCSPDFSVYADFPKAVQVFNHYRRNWLAKFWSNMGVNIIPTVEWSLPDSYEYCFDGLPKNSVVAVSSKGCLSDKKVRALFMRGYGEMLRRLEPKTILFFGDIPLECEGNVVHIEQLTDRFKQGRKSTEWLLNR